MEDGLLTIQGERHFAHDSSEQQFHRVERRYGAFRRSITLPAHVMAEGIQASFEDGVLQILVPKAEEAKPKRIQVRPGRTEVTAASSEGGPGHNAQLSREGAAAGGAPRLPALIPSSTSNTTSARRPSVRSL